MENPDSEFVSLQLYNSRERKRQLVEASAAILGNDSNICSALVNESKYMAN